MLSVLPFTYLFLKLGYNPYIPFIITLILQILVSNLYIFLLKKYIIEFSISNYYRKTIVPCILMFVLVTAPTSLLLERINIDNPFFELIIICCCTTTLVFLSVFLIVMSKNERRWILARINKSNK